MFECAQSHRFANDLLNSRDDVFAVCILLQRGKVGFDFLDDKLALRIVHQIEHFLDYVIGVLVFHHHLQWRNAIWNVLASELHSDILLKTYDA